MKRYSLQLLIFFIFLSSLLPPKNACAAEENSALNRRTISDAKIHELEGLHAKAEEHILKNDFSGAIKIYEDIVLDEPDDEVAYTGLGQCYLVLGQYERARNAYMNALHINPKNETAVAGLKKINDPDSIDFTEKRTVKVPIDQEVDEKPIVSKMEIAAQTVAPKNVSTSPIIQQNLNRPQQIQTALKNAGFYDGPIDGIIGSNTRTAVKNFQKNHNVSADGKVGPQTWELLKPFVQPNGSEKKVSA